MSLSERRLLTLSCQHTDTKHLIGLPTLPPPVWRAPRFSSVGVCAGTSAPRYLGLNGRIATCTLDDLRAKKPRKHLDCRLSTIEDRRVTAVLPCDKQHSYGLRARVDESGPRKSMSGVLGNLLVILRWTARLNQEGKTADSRKKYSNPPPCPAETRNPDCGSESSLTRYR